MTTTKKEIKLWLKSIGKDRQWLAQMCGVTKPTVDGWFRLAGVIPDYKLKLIKQKMKSENQKDIQIIITDYDASSKRLAFSIFQKGKLLGTVIFEKIIPDGLKENDPVFRNGLAYKKFLSESMDVVPDTMLREIKIDPCIWGHGIGYELIELAEEYLHEKPAGVGILEHNEKYAMTIV